MSDDRFPVPGGQLELIPIPADIYYEGGAITAKAGGTWGFNPLGVFVTDGTDSGRTDGPFDVLLPYKEVKAIVYDFDGFEKWKAQHENPSD